MKQATLDGRTETAIEKKEKKQKTCGGCKHFRLDGLSMGTCLITRTDAYKFGKCRKWVKA